MKFTCQMCGECCRRYAIPVTSSDIHRIIESNGQNPIHFLTLIEPDDSVIQTYKDHPKIRLRDGNNFVLVLAQNDDGCMFLENNKCSIHKAKPLVCKPFPFEYSITQGGEVEFSINEEARSFCRGLGKGSRLFDFTETEKFALSMEMQNDAFRKRVQQWNATALSQQIKSSEKRDVINFLITDINQQITLFSNKSAAP